MPRKVISPNIPQLCSNNWSNSKIAYALNFICRPCTLSSFQISCAFLHYNDPSKLTNHLLLPPSTHRYRQNLTAKGMYKRAVFSTWNLYEGVLFPINAKKVEKIVCCLLFIYNIFRSSLRQNFMWAFVFPLIYLSRKLGYWALRRVISHLLVNMLRHSRTRNIILRKRKSWISFRFRMWRVNKQVLINK